MCDICWPTSASCRSLFAKEPLIIGLFCGHICDTPYQCSHISSICLRYQFSPICDIYMRQSAYIYSVHTYVTQCSHIFMLTHMNEFMWDTVLTVGKQSHCLHMCMLARKNEFLWDTMLTHMSSASHCNANCNTLQHTAPVRQNADTHEFCNTLQHTLQHTLHHTAPARHNADTYDWVTVLTHIWAQVLTHERAHT